MGGREEGERARRESRAISFFFFASVVFFFYIVREEGARVCFRGLSIFPPRPLWLFERRFLLRRGHVVIERA